MPVLGIGTVELTTKPSPTSDATETITLTNVLHVPTYICNAIGQPIVKDHTVIFAKDEAEGGILTRSGKRLAHTKANHMLFAVAVLPPRDYAFGDSVFKHGRAYMVSCSWAQAEVNKWLAHKKKAAGQFDGSHLYKPEERKFLKSEYGGEYKFLRQNGLSIHKDEDREQGRAILRSVMHAANEDKNVKLGGKLVE
jgi:hypothetical protein